MEYVFTDRHKADSQYVNLCMKKIGRLPAARSSGNRPKKYCVVMTFRNEPEISPD